MTLFDGRKHAQALELVIHQNIPYSEKSGKILAIIALGKNRSSEVYVNLKVKFCEKFGIKTEVFKIHSSESDQYIADRVSHVFLKESVGGGIIQLPLPRLSLKSVLDLIPLDKDIDLLSSKSLDQYYSGDLSRLPPVVRSFAYFVKTNALQLAGKRAVIVGNGDLVGKPISYYLSKYGAKVQVMDNYETGQKLKADFIVLSAGVAGLVNGEDVSDNCHIVDYGSSIINSKTYGDLNMISKLGHLGIISPSPGGMGPLVVRFLVMNFLGI